MVIAPVAIDAGANEPAEDSVPFTVTVAPDPVPPISTFPVPSARLN